MKWKKYLRYVGVMGIALVIIAIAAACVIVRTRWFQNLVVQKIQQEVHTATGGSLDISSMAIDWRLLDVDFYGIVFHGREATSQAPLFAAHHLRVGLKIISVLRRQVDLNEIVLDQPSARLRIDAQGNSNLPQPSSGAQEKNGPDVFDMAIRHVEINSGQIYYNDEQIPVSAEIREFRTQVNFDRVGRQYRGSVAYSNGRVEFTDFNPIAHSLQLNFTAGRAGVVIDSVTVVAGKSTLTAQAKLGDYRDLNIDGEYGGFISTVELARIINIATIPSGDVTLNGVVRYHASSKRPPIENLYIDGYLASRELSAHVDQVAARASAIRADYRLQDGNLDVRSFEAALLGGNVHGKYELRHLGGDSSSQLDATIREVSLNALSGAAAPASHKSLRVSGRADGTLSGSWGSTIQNLAARAHFDIRTDKQASSEMSSAIPLTGLIDLTYDRKRNVASFNHSYLQTRNTKVSVTGSLSDRSQLDTQLETSDLREIAELVSMFRNGDSTPTDGRSSFPVDLRGSVRFEGELRGSVKAPRIKGTLSANNLEVDKSHWRSLQVGVDASPSSVALQNGALIAAQKGRVNFSGRADLNQWSFTDSSPLSLEVDARQMSIGDLQELSRFRYPVAGVLNANISVHGSQQNPQGRGRIQITEVSAWNERIEKLSVEFQGDGTSIHTETKLRSEAGDLAADVSYMPGTQEYEATVEASAIKLDQIQAVRDRKMGISGELKLSATGRGTVSNPQLVANIQIPRLQIRDQIISDVQTKLEIANRRAGFTLVSKTDQGSIEAKGDVGLEGAYPATASVDIRAIPVGVVLASYLPRDQKIQGTAELHADLTGPLKDPAAIVAHLEIPTLSVAYQSVQLALSRPLRVDYRNGLATLDPTEFKGTGTNLTLKGVIPVKSSSPLNISANGSIDLALLQGFATGVRSSGRIELNVGARGDLSRPAMEGEVRLVDATISAETVPVSLEGVNGRFQISGDRIEIAQFSGAAGGGTVSARGAITYGKQANFNVGLDMRSVRVRYPEGIRSILTGNLALNGTPEASSLTGRVLIDRLSFTQQFDLANFMGQFSNESPASVPSHLEQNMKLNVSVATADNLNLASSKVSIGGAANLSLGGTLADPVVLGRMSLNSGEIFFMGKRYDIQSGTIEFANPVRTTPVLNLYAKTTVQQYDITLNFVGPVDRLRTNFTSDPPLPPADIINLIGFGQTAEQAATSPSTPATLGAESVLAQGAASQVAGKIENLTGISQLTIDPLAGNSQANPGAQVAIQQRVTGNILLTFSTDVTSTENQAIQVQYQIKKNLSISVLRDEYGGYAADVRIHKTF